MAKRTSRRWAELESLLQRIAESSREISARAVGAVVNVEIESALRKEDVDHVWITLNVPPYGNLDVAVNILSKFNRDAGFDERVRVGVVSSKYVKIPAPVLEENVTLDYRTIETENAVEFATLEPNELAKRLISQGRLSYRIEAWGTLYRRHGLGLHQVHSQRASCALKYDVVDRDGALRFYLPNGISELWLFKFCGQ